MTIESGDTVADLDALARKQIAPADIGKSVYVTSEARHYEAMLEGRGADKWRQGFDPAGAVDAEVLEDAVEDIAELEVVGVFARRVTIDHEDAEVDVTEVSVEINIGSALPDNAVILGYTANVTEDFSDGATGAFGLDIGDGTTPDLHNPGGEIDIDGGVAFLEEWVQSFAGLQQIVATITGDVNLDTLTGGTVVVTVYFAVASVSNTFPAAP